MIGNYTCPHRTRNASQVALVTCILLNDEVLLKLISHLLMQGTLIKEPQRWSDRLQAYDFEIVYDECKDNIVASALY
jgi:hypothetical protein